MSWKVYCWAGLVCYALLSVADFRLTSALLNANGGAYESNPAAAACLEQHGWRGLAVYKAAGVVAFAGSLILLIRHRPKVGASVVTFGCVVLVSVTTYSYGLLRDTHREEADLTRPVLWIDESGRMVIDPEAGPTPTPGSFLAQ